VIALVTLCPSMMVMRYYDHLMSVTDNVFVQVAGTIIIRVVVVIEIVVGIIVIMIWISKADPREPETKVKAEACLCRRRDRDRQAHDHTRDKTSRSKFPRHCKPRYRANNTGSRHHGVPSLRVEAASGSLE
jgi:hypothetical protein